MSVNTDERSFPNPQSLNSCRTRDPNRCVTFPDQRSGFRPTQVLIIHLIILPLLKKTSWVSNQVARKHIFYELVEEKETADMLLSNIKDSSN